MDQNMILSPIPKGELCREIADRVFARIEEAKRAKVAQHQRMTARQVMDYMQITNPTLCSWDKKGITNPIYVNGRKFYETSEILNLGTKRTAKR